MPEQDPAATTTLIGQVDAVHGPVVDICTRYLPPLNQALMVRDHREPVLLEVF
ncbi:MAG: F0F1 ATP synthase subunit beta, partial [Pseudomonadales bacterium]|nr:F0F1 ATP synthase subunit beta [Pseudomonadales bacterium]